MQSFLSSVGINYGLQDLVVQGLRTQPAEFAPLQHGLSAHQTVQQILVFLIALDVILAKCA